MSFLLNAVIFGVLGVSLTSRFCTYNLLNCAYKICACAPPNRTASGRFGASRLTEKKIKKARCTKLQKNENSKTERLYIRVTKKEKSMLTSRAKAAGFSLSKYILILSERKRIINPEPIVRLIIEVNRIGNNINQVAKIANTNKNISQKQIEIIQKQMEFKQKLF